MANGTFSQMRLIPFSWDWERDTFRATLVDVDQHPLSLTEDRFIADIPPASRVQTVELTGRRQEGARHYCDGFSFDGVGTPDNPINVEIIFWQDTGNETNSLLIGVLSYKGKPITMIGGTLSYILDDNPLMYAAV